jgi:hypothetical protein
MAAVFAAPTAAYAAAGLVDGTVTSGSTTCSWVNASTSDTPPNPLTIAGSTVKTSCNDGTTLTVNNNPNVTFDDANGTAAVDAIDVTGTKFGTSCRYRATNLVLNRSGTTRTYSGGPYTGNLVSGGFFCSGTLTVNSASVTFH